MWDIHHSPVWKEAYSQDGYFEGDLSGICYALELDGVNPFHNIGVMYSMTPIMLTMLNLPRHIRNSFGNINLVGIIPAHGKVESSNLDPYLEILVDELLYLSRSEIYSSYKRAPVLVKIKLLNYVLDYPGLSKLFHIHGSGSLSGCHWCHVRGKRCEHLDNVVYLHNRSYLDKKDHLRRDEIHFVSKDLDNSTKPHSRSVQSEMCYRDAFDTARNKTQASFIATATGCKSNYILSELPGHDRVNECVPDACHTVKDVVQNIMNLVTGNKVNTEKIVAAEKKMKRTHVINRSIDEHEVTHGNNSALFVEDTSASANKKRKAISINNNSKQSSAKKKNHGIPFQLTKDELSIADKRASSIRVPLGFGLKPSPFISKSGCLKSHYWKQMAVHGILKYCLRDTLGQNCRETLYFLLDCIAEMCSESITSDDIDTLEKKLNKALALLEMHFPIHLQNITTHILHHIPDGMRRYGPVYGTWMFTYERFNSWICKRVNNMRYPEATAIETFLLHDWCHFMLSSDRISLGSLEHCDDVIINENDDVEKEPERSSFKCTAKAVTLSRRAINSIHRVCGKDENECKSCTFQKNFYHRETHSNTNRTVSYSSESRERVAAKTVSSYVTCEFDRGAQSQKVGSNNFIEFGRIQYFIEHTSAEQLHYPSPETVTLAYVKLIDNVQYDRDSGLWFVQNSSDVCDRSRFKYVLTSNLGNPLVTAIDEGDLWFLNCGKKHYNFNVLD